MAKFDQFANQGGAAAWDPTRTAEAKRVAEEQLQNADYSGTVPEPLGQNAAPHELDDDYLGDDDASDFSDDELGDAEVDDDTDYDDADAESDDDPGSDDSDDSDTDSSGPRY